MVTLHGPEIVKMDKEEIRGGNKNSKKPKDCIRVYSRNEVELAD